MINVPNQNLLLGSRIRDGKERIVSDSGFHLLRLEIPELFISIKSPHHLSQNESFFIKIERFGRISFVGQTSHFGFLISHSEITLA